MSRPRADQPHSRLRKHHEALALPKRPCGGGGSGETWPTGSDYNTRSAPANLSPRKGPWVAAAAEETSRPPSGLHDPTGLYLGDQDIAANRRELAHLRITHVLNASHSKWRGGAEYYEGTGIRYLGIEAHDSPSFDMSPYFYPAADFIHQALNEGRILVHCAVGVSRSATLVLAYLMIRHHMPLVEAIKTVKDHRGIIPNRGFLRQLVALDNALRMKRSA
ncbi:dual specificity protein phosphatase 26 [Patagioenas fasciata monilis]|uniref:Dual specificity protein phosphatase n=1 Tax=Patagioenas fasciata monilis TaxID=372326 RepID=A0A1V4KHL7_PATFA|nr:dual specificity protein phosphatase 26 [Patagioenas fasciata monilis]